MANPNAAARGLHSQVVDVIGERIVSGSYAPGSSLQPDQLEQELGVSKTVVREALRVLASKGLIDSRQKRGTFVRPRADWSLLDSDLLRWQGRGVPDVMFLENLAEVRAIVEPASARLAAMRRTEDDLTALDDAIARMRQATGDFQRTIEADLSFHRSLLYAAHNELLTRMEVVIEAGLRVRDHFVHGADHATDPVPGHQAIVAAIRGQDADAAEAAVQRLLELATADQQELIARKQSHTP